MVLMAENEVKMRSMMEKLDKYLDRKGLRIKREKKSKVLRRGGERWKK